MAAEIDGETPVSKAVDEIVICFHYRLWSYTPTAANSIISTGTKSHANTLETTHRPAKIEQQKPTGTATNTTRSTTPTSSPNHT